MKFIFFLKIRLIFNLIYCFCMFVNKHFTSRMRVSQKAKGVIVRNLRHIILCIKTKILIDFDTCISVPLIL